MDSSPFEEQPQPNPFSPPPGALLGRSRPAPSPSPRQRSSANTAGRRLQPTYDLIAGSPSPVPQSSLFVAVPAPPRAGDHADISNENLRADLNTVRYELNMLREERQLEKIRHEQELRAVEVKAEEHAKRVDAVETDKRFLFDKQKEFSDLVQSVKGSAASQKQDLERQIRKLKSENAELKDLVNYKDDELGEETRRHRKEKSDYEARISSMTETMEEFNESLAAIQRTMDETQKRLTTKDAEVQDLETELLRVKTQTGDMDTLRVLKKELSEQVNHIKSLESTNRRQATELKQLRESLRTLEVVEEEKRALECKVKVLEDMRQELSNAELRASVLQDEKNAWESYFHSENLEFDSPEALARALVEERLDRATLMEKAGRANPDMAQKDQTISELQGSLETAQQELSQLRERLAKENKSRQRLERQKAMALKEAEFLREQLNSFSSEETIYMQGNFDEEKTKSIQALETLLEQYKNEIAELNETIKGLGGVEGSNPGSKRHSEDRDDDRIGQLTRKNRQLQDELEQRQRNIALAEKEIQALKRRLASMEGTSTRILQLKDNPTSRDQTIKASQLASLREENASLLAQLEGRNVKSVPLSTLENARADIKSMEKVVAEKEKRMTRLKEIWSAKSLEFREAVYSLLGWKLDFMPNGRVKVTHMFAGNSDQSIEFDGEKGTMKISGGPDSTFSREIRNTCQFWMQRQSIPCLLASILIERYEMTTRAQQM